MKYILMLDTPFWMIVSGSLTAYVFALRRRMAGLDDPRLWLKRAERRALAKERIAQQEYERNINIINGE